MVQNTTNHLQDIEEHLYEKERKFQRNIKNEESDAMAYKIKWKDGSTTAEAYSSKALAEKILKIIRGKGTVVKASLANPPRSPLSGKKTVWIRNKPFGNLGGFIYHTRAISALSKAEKKRVVRVK